MTKQEHITEMLEASNSKLALVHPILADKVRTLMVTLANYEGLDLYFAVTMGLRTFEQQDALYAQGRTAPGNKVTNAKGGQSWHNFGLAVDLAEDGDPDKAGIQWSWAKLVDFYYIGKVAQEVGLSWGGLWKTLKDYPHVELTADLTLEKANELYSTGGLPAVYQYVSQFYGDNSA